MAEALDRGSTEEAQFFALGFGFRVFGFSGLGFRGFWGFGVFG